MSLFTPSFYTTEPNFSGLFRLIDEFDKYSSQAGEGKENQVSPPNRKHHVQTFTPKFDLKETESTYELHGELPGIEKENVSIEFDDEQTITIRGKVVRSYTSGETPESEDGVIVHNNQQDKASKNGDGAEKKSSSTEVAKSGNEQNKQVGAAQSPKVKYWVSERSVGEFSRSFTFPDRVESEKVTAKLDNGILHVTVPKAQKPLGRRIAIN